MVTTEWWTDPAESAIKPFQEQLRPDSYMISGVTLHETQ